MTGRHEETVDRTLDELRHAGVREGEVFFRDGRGTSVEVNDGVVESTEVTAERGVGVRVLDGARVGFAYTSDLTPAGIGEVVELARGNARVTTPDESIAIASAPPPSDDLGLYEAGFDDRDVRGKVELAFAIERAAREADPRITSFRKTSYGDGEGWTVIATTLGARGAYRETSFGGGTSCVAVDGEDRQIGYFGDGGHRFVQVEAARIGREAARRAVEKLGARGFATGTLDVVLEPYLAMSLLGAIGSLFSAENVLKGKSLLRGKLGERVASEHVTIRDEGRRRGGNRTAPFDGEGTPTRDVVLVERGILRGYLHSIKTAARMRAERTGNARRGSYSGTPHVGISNFSIAPGARPTAELVRGRERALAITSLLNLHTIDPISGDFSLAATATYLERGVPLYPVKGIAIAGNLIRFLSSIAAVGDDMTWGASGIGSPTLIVGDVSVGGS